MPKLSRLILSEMQLYFNDLNDMGWMYSLEFGLLRGVK